jgi:hypothetical protein
MEREQHQGRSGEHTDYRIPPERGMLQPEDRLHQIQSENRQDKKMKRRHQLDVI